MNDFTKEELKFLLNWGIDSCEINNVEIFKNKKEMGIFNKLQSMIDNYCDHHLINYCCGCDPENIVCDKCHTDLWGKKLR